MLEFILYVIDRFCLFVPDKFLYGTNKKYLNDKKQKGFQFDFAFKLSKNKKHRRKLTLKITSLNQCN